MMQIVWLTIVMIVGVYFICLKLDQIIAMLNRVQPGQPGNDDA